MKILHFDCFSGISGDMTLGALVALGVDAQALKDELAKLPVHGWQLDFKWGERGDLLGLQALVTLEDHNCCDEHSHHSPHHAWKDIRLLLELSTLTAGAKTRALAIFTRLAEAEAAVHGVAPEAVCFHEVGALDSIIDIVGTAICLDMLAPDKITCGPIELGGGTVRCAHGVLPVPAPATRALVAGFPVTIGGFDCEMTTPTGAAILAASAVPFEADAVPVLTLRKSEFGLGGRVLDNRFLPNVLGVTLYETVDKTAHDWEECMLTHIEATIDDMTGEELSFLMERLFAAGALDVTMTPCVVKKSRPAHIVGALVPPHRRDAVRVALFVHSTTAGFRETTVCRLSLKRENGLNAAGERTKTLFLDGTALRSKVEFDDRADAARKNGRSILKRNVV